MKGSEQFNHFDSHAKVQLEVTIEQSLFNSSSLRTETFNIHTSWGWEFIMCENMSLLVPIFIRS